MFNKGFYPSPEPVIELLMEGTKLSESMAILEPSAGKGDILDWIVKQLQIKRYGYSSDFNLELVQRNLFAIEIEPELQAILIDKGYKLIDSDFLSYTPERDFDLIVMNPSFDVGAKHLLHAMEIDPYAEIRCLLNADTIANPYTKERQLLIEKLSACDAVVENLGQCFAAAERKTGVAVAMVEIPAQERPAKFAFNFDSLSAGGEKLYQVEEIRNNQVETSDVAASLVHRYNKMRELATQMKSIQAEMHFYANGLLADTRMIDEISKLGVDSFTDELRKSAWRAIFSQTKLENLVTSDVRKSLEKQQSVQGNMAFTESNIYTLMLILSGSLKQIRNDCVQHAFETLTRYHAKNKVHVEGWKTNKAWKINRKCILPGSIDFWGGKGSIDYQRRDRLADIEKALCMLSGCEYSEIKEQCLSHYDFKIPDTGEWFDSYFFEYKGFKKGTLHLKFKDERLWNRFNYEAAAGRNWLPEGAAA